MNIEAYKAGYAAYFDESSCSSDDLEYVDAWMEGYYDAEDDAWEKEGLDER